MIDTLMKLGILIVGFILLIKNPIFYYSTFHPKLKSLYNVRIII